MANGRIFGPKAWEYGTRMPPLLEDSIWKTEEELAEVFIQSMDHLYAEKRGYWQATKEEMEKLRVAYLDMEGEIEEGLSRVSI
jgi:cobaltochelatase CobN